MDFNIIKYDSLESTNGTVKTNIESLSSGDVVFTENQTAGRGRQGNRWLILPGEAAAFSVLLKDIPLLSAQSIPLIAGLAAASGIEKLCGKAVYIKWPNDIIIADKKVCGILCETVTRNGNTSVIAGFGVNISQKEDFFTKTGLPHAISLYEAAGALFTPLQAANAVLERFGFYCQSLTENGFESIKDEYSEYCLTLDKQVLVNGVSARALGIADNGGLICEFGDGIKTVTANEVSVRGLFGYI